MTKGKLALKKKYLKRLSFFAYAIGVKLKVNPFKDEGVWLPAVRVVRVDVNMGDTDLIATLLHELGHALDDVLTPSGRKTDKIYKAYRAMYKGRPTAAQKRLVVSLERKAWRYGRDIAARLNIRLGKWYDDIEKDSIKSYLA